MKLARGSGTLGLAVLAAIASPLAAADDSGGYVGIGAGQSRAKIDDARISSNLLGAGFASTTVVDDKRDTGYKLFGGYKFNQNFALEGGYFDLGKFGYTATTVPAGTLRGDIRLKGLNLDAVGILPITEKLSAIGRVGLNYAEARDSFAGTGFVNVLNPNPRKSDTNYKLGLGLQYDFTESLGVRFEAERYRINDAVGNRGDVDLVSVGLVYRFGEKAQAPTPRIAERQRVFVAPPPLPEAVTPQPPPPPAPTVVAPPRVLKKVTFTTDSLFAFDKADIKPGGTQHLDKLAADLKDVSFELITVTGHSDRLGPHEYNINLSMRRAEAVKTYLVKSAGIPAVKFEVKGVDGSDPVTKPGECKGETATAQLIACLQPDRRVEVEVTATQSSR